MAPQPVKKKYGTAVWYGYLVVFALAMVLVVAVRIRLLNAPLERDEGEHAYGAQLMLRGYVPWKLSYNMKLPGADALYAASMALFGQTASAIRMGLLIANVATIFLAVLLGRSLFGASAGIVAGTCYALLSAGQGVYGTVAHATHFVALFATAAILWMLRAAGRRSLGEMSGAGLMFGIAFLMKQPGLAFAAFGAVYLIGRFHRDRGFCAKVVTVLVGCAALPYALLCSWLWREGIFARFWFWTVTLAQAFANSPRPVPKYEFFLLSFPVVAGADILIWIAAAGGLAMTFIAPSTKRAGVFVAVLLIFSFAAVSAGGVYSEHYFIMLMPALSLAAGGGAAAIESLGSHAGSRWLRLLPEACFAVIVLLTAAVQYHYLLVMTPIEFVRATYGRQPFPEAIPVSDYIRTHSRADSTIAVLGSEAEIYFYARRRAATGYLFTYGLMEPHRYAAPMQGEMIGEIENAKPEYIVEVAVAPSWLVRPDSDRLIFDWAESYAARYYQKVGAVDMRNDSSVYVWGVPEAAAYRFRSPEHLIVYRRKPESDSAGG